jgi:hypothetical protein
MEEAAKRPSKFDRPNEWHSSEDKYWRESMDRERKAWEAKRASRKNGHAYVSREKLTPFFVDVRATQRSG